MLISNKVLRIVVILSAVEYATNVYSLSIYWLQSEISLYI